MYKHFGQRASVFGPVGVVDGRATGQPRRPPAVRPSGDDDVLTGGQDGNVFASRVRCQKCHVDAMR